MKTLCCAILTVLAPLGLAADAVRPAAPIELFNGRDLAGWVIVGRDGDPAAQASWKAGDGVLATTGQPYGYIRTAQAFRDYKLRVEWRWTSTQPPVDDQGKPRARNSGVLLHTQGDDKVWPRCLEAQLQENNAGDFIAMDTVVFSELLALREKAAAAAADDHARRQAQGARRMARQHPSSEKPVGEWNVYEIVCRGDRVVLTVNGVQQNTATGVTVSEGWIALQSEGAPMEFRRIELSPLN